SIEAKQESTKPSLKEEIKAAWKSGPEKAEKERMEKEKVKNFEQLEAMKRKVQNDLKQKDGKHHILLIKSKYGYFNSARVNACDEQYIYSIEDILEMIQDKGYEIVDIKIIGIQTTQGWTERIEVVIVYK
ncbi:MAG: hypothetical protein HFJ32_03225, partial [Clostridia bacterium]|nr:hypothetical protein [Clostridia bacterium]